MDQRIEQAQRLFWEIERLREQGACRMVNRKLIEMAKLHEERARELLSQRNPDGWIDWYAAVTARAEAGGLREAFGLIQEGRGLSTLFPNGQENIEGQLKELDAWIDTLQATIPGIPSDPGLAGVGG